MPAATQNRIEQVFETPAQAAVSVLSNDRPTTFYIWLVVLGCATMDFTVLDMGKYSILLIYIAAVPFCWKVTRRSLTFLLLPLISTALAVLVSFLQGNVNPMGIASQGALQLLAIFFAAGVAALDWRKYFTSLSKSMVAVGLPIVVFGGYQMFARIYHWKFAFLPVTNQQAYAVGGLQRGWEKSVFTRASSLFAEPSEFGYYCLWLMILGLSSKGKARILALCLAFSGMLFSQSLSGALGVAVLLIAYVSVNPISFNIVRHAAIVVIASVIAVLAIQPLAPEAFDKFSERITQAVTLDNRADSGRVDHLPANWESFKEAPIWGKGLASITAAEDNGVDVTTFTYLLVLIERGLVGGFFFMAPWFWLAYRATKLPVGDALRTPCILLSVLSLYTFANSAIVYTLTYWLALGICASCVLGTYLPVRHLALVFQSPLDHSKARQ